MMIDIFQHSNMYTLRKNVQWLADEPHVKDECGPYVTKPGNSEACFHAPVLKDILGKPIPDWPKLLHLYSRLKPGRTVFEWMESHEVHELGIDVRRFTSFGVIKVRLRNTCRATSFNVHPLLGFPPPSPPLPSLYPRILVTNKSTTTTEFLFISYPAHKPAHTPTGRFR